MLEEWLNQGWDIYLNNVSIDSLLNPKLFPNSNAISAPTFS